MLYFLTLKYNNLPFFTFSDIMREYSEKETKNEEKISSIFANFIPNFLIRYCQSRND
ncbi:Uncharacterised protein [Streptococcus pneumoniae]|nr:Uncharacterised protein [Streptococcus pneumoniae]